MINFLIKKSFFDAWDNLLVIILLNFAAIVLITALVFLMQFVTVLGGYLFYPLLAITIILLHLLTGLISALTGRLSEQESIHFRLIPEFLIKYWKNSLLAGIVSFVIIFMDITVILNPTVYSGIAGLISIGILSWTNLIWMAVLQYYFSFQYRMEDPFLKTLKKSLLIVLDNPGFSFFAILFSLILMTLSVITFFLIPGIAGILLFHQNALKLRLHKYDWLEGQSGNKKKIPWSDLLTEDNEKLGKRSFRGMIFPWKD